MRVRHRIGRMIAGAILWAVGLPAIAAGTDPAIERGRVAMTLKGHLKPEWGDDAYRRVGKFWGEPAPDPDQQPEAYADAFRRHYGLHLAPFPNDGLPMGLRRGNRADGTSGGLQIDCLVCHGGSIGGTSYVGLGNTTLDMRPLLAELTRADGRWLPPTPFTINSTRGTVNAGMFAAVLLSVRNPDMSVRSFPRPLGANLPEMDVPAWWLLGKKATMYYDGRTDARSARSTMQFLLGEKSLADLKALEPAFQDIMAYLKSLQPPKYPFAIESARADRGKGVFNGRCAKCHGTYGPDGSYPNRIVELKVIGTDPARALGLSDRLVAHYNTTWLGEDYPVDDQMVGYQAPPLDGLWATAPYLHNGSVPTLATLLKSTDRPSRFKRPPSTAFEHYDHVNVGWKFEPLDPSSESPMPPAAARFLYDTSRFGLGNAGHTFGDRLGNDERRDLIEYLKTL